ncbi:hypothetical protein [Streptomyces sp. NPDC060366]|uniref:hypothetical protein n=1 Tax=Streptomyces sp. NPDC060366 TaxID=3347105 RepID=UPI00366549AF
MTTSTMPMATKRKARTRTKRVSHRPAIVVSMVLPNLIDLLPGTESLVCPDCETWCPITGHDGLTPKLVPHHTGRAGTGEARRCGGSNRRVTIDLTIAEWRHLLADAIKETSSRRATNVLRKPKVALVPAVMQIVPVSPGPETARTTYRSHVKACPACSGRIRCAEGRHLADIYTSLTRHEPRRQQIRAAIARERARFDRIYAAQAVTSRAAEWGKQAETKVKRSALAKRSGTAVEDTNNTCRFIVAGAVSGLRGPELPIKPIRITA